MSHAKFNRELRVRDMQTTFSGITSSDISVPADFVSPYSLKVGNCPLTFVGEAEADQRREHCISGIPRYYTIFGSKLELIPTVSAGTSYTLRYYAQIPLLVNADDTNWLLLKSFDLYTYGALLEATPYLEHDERLETWAGLRQQIMLAMSLESEQALHPQGQMRAQLRTFG